jgi:hypothetical protein
MLVTRPLLDELHSMLASQAERELELSQKVDQVQSTFKAKEIRELELHSQVNSLQSTLKKIGSQQSELLNLLGCLSICYRGSAVSAQPSTLRKDTFSQEWESIATRYLGMNVLLIASEVDGKIQYSIHIRWPLVGTKVLNGRISSSWRSWFTPSIRPNFRVQNIIPLTSEIVKACCNGMDSKVNELLLSGEAHPNDTTENNLTLLYVSVYHP